MKRIISVASAIAVIMSLFVIQASAISGSMSSSTSTPRAGETFTVTFRVDGKVTGFQGTLNYDSSIVSLTGVSSRCGSNWSFTQSGGSIVAYDTGTSSPQTAGLFDATFKVNSGVSVGTKVSISFASKLTPSDGSGSTNSTGTYSGTVAAPLSTDCTLSSLKVSNATLSPAFNANTTSYSCGTVSFDVAKLGVTATANGDGATVSVSGANLSVGANTVNVVVTAASGTKKTYTITVEREQDPDYVASNDTKLAGIEISTGTLSPEFNVDQREYVVYVPYEVTTFTATGTAANELAKGVENIEDAKLEIGTNELVLKVTAEDDTVGEYKIYVVRMDKFGGVDTVGIPASLIDAKDVEEPEETPVSGAITLEYWMIGVGAAVALLIGFLFGMLIFKKRKNKGNSEEPENPDDGGNTPSDESQDGEIVSEGEAVEESNVYEDISSGSVETVSTEEPMQFEDIDTGRDDVEADVDEYAEAEVEEGTEEASVDDYIPQHAAPVAEPEPPAPVITFADLTGEKVEEPVAEERPHVHYIAYEEYIDSLDNEK